MVELPRVQLWDSSLFVSFITGQETKRVDIVRTLLEIYDRGGLQIVISSFAIAEVRRIPNKDAIGPTTGQEEQVETIHFDETRLERIRNALRSDRLDVRVLTPRIAELAADIGNRYPKLLPADCTHIATAIEANVDVLFTYDGVGQRRRSADMLRYDGRISKPGGPPLRIAEPYVPSGPLFDPPIKETP